jgi:hypothetical protein
MQAIIAQNFTSLNKLDKGINPTYSQFLQGFYEKSDGIQMEILRFQINFCQNPKSFKLKLQLVLSFDINYLKAQTKLDRSLVKHQASNKV